MKHCFLIAIAFFGFAWATPAAAQLPLNITVKVAHGITDAPVANTPVFLRAARPRGPFEPTAPKPDREWTGFTNEQGVATFANVDADLATRGLKLHATTVYTGVKFDSAAVTPAAGVGLSVKVYEKGADLSGITISNLRTVVEIWEGYMVFTQFYSLTNKAETVLDMSMLPGKEFERGLPIHLPIEAKGPQITGPGETIVVEETAYWKGTLVPGASVPLQVRFSVTAKSPDLVYEQTLDYPVESLEIVVPLQTQFAKLPRLSNLSLAAPGFEVLSGKGIMGLRGDMEFLGAKRDNLEKGGVLRFKLDGLPFHRPIAPFVVLGFAVLFAIGVMVFGQRELKISQSQLGRKEVLAALQSEKEALFEELVLLERDQSEGTISDTEYEYESLALRERLALVMKKIGDVEASMT